MASEWGYVPIESIAQGIFDGPHATPKKTATGPIFLGISSLVGGRLDISQSEHLSEADFVKWTRRVTPRAGDLVFSYETRLGEAALVPDGLRCCLGRRMALIRPNPSKVDSRFLLYAYLGPQFQETLRQRTVHGSTVDRIPLIDFPSFQIQMPPLDEQRRIAAVLGALDDKIELNRKMNRTLEAMAQALFKSWFIDFDGVPDTDLVESELGPIPKGWAVRPLVQLASVSGGKQLPRERYVPDGSVTVFGANGPMGRTAATTHDGFVISFGRVGANCGSLYWSLRGAWINNNASAITPNASSLFLLQALLNIDFAAYRTGSAQPFIPQSALERIPILTPSMSCVPQFESIARELRERQLTLDQESQTLSELRDTLLPKLISGELRVPEAETTVEAVL